MLASIHPTFPEQSTGRAVVVVVDNTVVVEVNEVDDVELVLLLDDVLDDVVVATMIWALALDVRPASSTIVNWKPSQSFV